MVNYVMREIISLISKNTIEKVFEISRVEEVIGEFIQLKKSGSNLKDLVHLLMKRHRVLYFSSKTNMERF